jgi:hypothetical protein
MLIEEYRELSGISLQELGRLKKLGDTLLIGGWAAHFLVNDRFREWKKIDYIGSKDIDLGIREKDLSKMSGNLVRMGYTPINFRFFKVFDRETKKEISEAESRNQQIHRNFYLYVDLVLDSPSREKTAFFGDDAIKLALDSRLWTMKNGMRIIAPELLLLTKLRILGSRNEEKRVKDMLDCLFVSNFSSFDIDLFRGLRGKFGISRANLNMARKTVESGLVNAELSGLRFDSAEIRGVKTAFLSLL